MVRPFAAAALLLLLSLTAAAPAPPVISADNFRDCGLRGFNLDANTTLTADDLRAMRGEGANLARMLVQATRSIDGQGYVLSPASLAAADRYAAIGAATGFRLLLALEPLPNNWRQEFWADDALQRSLVEAWRTLARRYRGVGAIAGFDLLNEPIATTHGSKAEAFSAEGARRWTALATAMIDAIRAIDRDHPIVVEPSPGALPHAFTLVETAIARDNLVYSTHFYEPLRLTHQGILSARRLAYPGVAADKAGLAAALEPVRRFAARTGRPIYVGEFSIVRWAPDQSAHDYLADLLELIAGQERWSWTYHAWRECPCWDPEIPSSFFQRFAFAGAKPIIPPEVSPAAQRTQTRSLAVLREYLRAGTGETRRSPPQSVLPSRPLRPQWVGGGSFRSADP